jgi:hypothetical protein
VSSAVCRATIRGSDPDGTGYAGIGIVLSRVRNVTPQTRYVEDIVEREEQAAVGR